MTKPKYAGAKPARKCIFCGANANSKEHFWPEWIHPLISEGVKGRHGRQLYSYHPTSGAKLTGPNNRQGGRQTIRIRAVCRECNQGWMSELEQAVRPTLTALATGKPFFFSEAQQHTVARWVTLKCLVAEHDKPGLDVTPPEALSSFKDHLEIPDFFRIYAMPHTSRQSLFYVRRTHHIIISDWPIQGAPKDVSKNIQTISFLVGKCFFHVNAARAQGFEIEKAVNIFAVWPNTRIWPLQRKTKPWPHPPLLDEQGIGFVESTLERLIHATRDRWV